MVASSKEKLVHVNKCLDALGCRPSSPRRLRKKLKELGIEVMAEFPFGRGVSRMMKQSQMDELVAIHRAPAPQLELLAPESAPAAPKPFSLALLESRVDAQTAEITKIREEVASLAAANKQLADRLGRILESLGCAT